MLGNILQQTYSLIDAAIVGKMLGVNALAAVGASVSIVFFDIGLLPGVLLRVCNPRGAETGGAGYAGRKAYIMGRPENIALYFHNHMRGHQPAVR